MNLVIVESPSKTKKIEKFLGKGWRVVASYGHVRDLPRKALGVDVKNHFAPTYEIGRGKKKTVDFLRSAAKKADAIYLATDPDREGEAIAWHLQQLLEPKCPVHRVTFNEITSRAIQAAFQNERQLHMQAVNSQQARRILDRLVGWKVSPILRLKYKTPLSAGRVQSVAVRLVVEREQVICAFKPEQSWSLSAHLATNEGAFIAKLVTLLAQSDKDLDPKRLPAKRAQSIAAELAESNWQVNDIEAKEKKRRPPPPFITSTLQQKASSQLKMKPKRTMEVAQKLYEEGHITYMRTDSPAVAAEAQQAAREVIQTHFPQALPDNPPIYRAKGKAQEAHECIRPTTPALLPDDAPLSGEQAALYQLIWTRFIGSQMKPAIYHVVVATISIIKDGQPLPVRFAAQGKSLHAPGWLLLEKKENDDDILPALKKGQPLLFQKLETKEQWTKPPSRYTEPKLIQALEKAGVGRPSTYASIMETIQERGYVTDTGKNLTPTESGVAVTQFLIKQFPDLLNLDFTKQMEDDLDRIAAGEVRWQAPLSKFHAWLVEHLDLSKQALLEEGILKPCPKCEGVIATLTGKYGEYQRCLSCGYKPSSGKETGESCPECGKALVERAGKHGKFVSCSGYPECKYKPLPTTGESCPQCGKPLVRRMGKQGEFVSCSGYPECKYKPLPTTGESCPECRKPLVRRMGKQGEFVSCSGYPECKYKPLATTGESCPECQKPLVERTGKAGRFIGCSGYPECRYIKPTNTGQDCPDCGKPLVKRKGKHGTFVGCSGYPECRYISPQNT